MRHQKLPSLLLRPLQQSDVPAMQRIQLACYGAALIESAAVMQARAVHPRSVSWVVAEPENPNRIKAYLVAYCSQRGCITGLNAPFECIGESTESVNQIEDLPIGNGAKGAKNKPDTLYLHDLAVDPSAAGQGLGQQLVAKVLAVAQQQMLDYAALVAVQDAHSFWMRRGFKAQTLENSQQPTCLAEYGAGACYMLRKLRAIPS